MAYPADFITTLVKVGSPLAEQFVGKRSLISSVYQDVDLNEMGEKGKTVNIVVPGASTVSNDASSVGTFNSPTTSLKSITLSQMPAVNQKITEWEKLISKPEVIDKAFVQPAMTALTKYLNGQLATLMVAATLNTYTPVPHVTNRTLVLSQLRDARILMREQGVPVDSLGDMSLVMPSKVYEYTLITDQFNRSDIQGPGRSETAWATGSILQTFATNFYADDDMPSVAGSPAKLTSCLFHKYAIAAAFRPLEVPDPSTGTFGSYLNMNGIPVRALMSFDHINKSWYLSWDLAFGFAVIRPECACLIYHNDA